MSCLLPLLTSQVALRLYAVPEAISAAVCCFPDLKSAVESAQAVMASSIPVGWGARGSAALDRGDGLIDQSRRKWTLLLAVARQQVDHRRLLLLSFRFHALGSMYDE